MELKDVILSTLAELEDASSSIEQVKTIDDFSDKEALNSVQSEISNHLETPKMTNDIDAGSDEVRMLEGIRERLLVLFEGFQSPNNVQLEAKIDLTLNFLEYLLAMIDNRLDTLKED